jgi:hypothetical protein
MDITRKGSLHLIGRRADAMKLFDRLASFRNNLGLLAEYRSVFSAIFRGYFRMQFPTPPHIWRVRMRRLPSAARIEQIRRQTPC